MDRKQPGHTQPLWDRTSKTQDRLREPKSANVSGGVAVTNNHNHQDGRGGSHSQNNPNPNNTTSGLNVNAPEFVPTWLKSPVMDLQQQFQNVQIAVGEVPPPSRTSAQDRLHKYKTSGHSNEHAARCYNDTNPIMNGCGDEDDSTDLMRLKNIIKSLKIYPGQFDDLLEVFMESIFPYFNDVFTMAKIAQLLIGQAVNCPNFHYTGVRLCWYVEQQCPEFRAELHLRCQKEMQENPNQQNVALFIAELYTQLPHDNLYGSLLIESLTGLLNIGGNDNVKCVCQALKLTGFSLEQNNKQALDDLFAKLKSMKNSVSGSALHLLESVVNLREANWGRATESNSESSDYYDQNCEEIVNEILYESDGLIFTTEEQEFLVTHASNHDDYMIDNDDPDALYDPEPEMTEEMQADFKEFVKLSKG
ncbi:polyadenylate-binding protein-interacting protein 1 [Anthonomus grandis grandis]|uniref:polyadenylate-binding protein-interacting protein 1 n=1 Tax=Anthonomus grandis grandis TaxID=2921223 RepID=UPI002165333E|nr:polyadenylate-binding protein-interacting protein 1 [Anthonomus grandis grandis]